MIDSQFGCDWGRARPSSSRTQGAALAGGKGKAEDAEMRSAGHPIRACGNWESIIYGGA
jgi:hypothetical protein